MRDKHRFLSFCIAGILRPPACTSITHWAPGGGAGHVPIPPHLHGAAAWASNGRNAPAGAVPSPPPRVTRPAAPSHPGPEPAALHAGSQPAQPGARAPSRRRGPTPPARPGKREPATRRRPLRPPEQPPRPPVPSAAPRLLPHQRRPAARAPMASPRLPRPPLPEPACPAPSPTRRAFPAVAAAHWRRRRSRTGIANGGRPRQSLLGAGVRRRLWGAEEEKEGGGAGPSRIRPGLARPGGPGLHLERCPGVGRELPRAGGWRRYAWGASLAGRPRKTRYRPVSGSFPGSCDSQGTLSHSPPLGAVWAWTETHAGLQGERRQASVLACLVSKVLLYCL